MCWVAATHLALLPSLIFLSSPLKLFYFIPLDALKGSHIFLTFLFLFSSHSCVVCWCIGSVSILDSRGRRGCVSSQISNNFFFSFDTDTETQRDCLFLDSQAFSSLHTLPSLTHTSHKDISHKCFTRSAPEEVAFFITIPPSCSPPIPLSVSTSRSGFFLNLFVLFAEAVLILGLSLSSLQSLFAQYF